MSWRSWEKRKQDDEIDHGGQVGGVLLRFVTYEQFYFLLLLTISSISTRVLITKLNERSS